MPWALPTEAGTYIPGAAGKGAPIETRLVEGDPWREIKAAAEALPADLVVMGTHGRSGFERLLLGSVTEKVLRTAPCPVLTVGTEDGASPAGPLFRRILCAADLTQASERTLDMAASLAEESLARVTLLHVVEGLGLALVEEARERLQRAGNVARRFRDVSERVETGTAWREILRVAEESRAELIVLGAHVHGALGRLFLGSTANQVVRHAPCPVLVVRETLARRPSEEESMAVTV
jgi:nucleotide-binding universal stress UspA family protein